jgi:hypothetical protein
MSEHPVLVDIRIYWRYNAFKLTASAAFSPTRMHGIGPHRAGNTSVNSARTRFSFSLDVFTLLNTINMGILSWFKKVRDHYL